MTRPLDGGLLARVFSVVALSTLALSYSHTPVAAHPGAAASPASKAGTAFSWGANGSGQLGTNAPLGDTPLQVQGLQNVVAVADGGTHMLALLQDGTVMAWGSNAAGELGLGSPSLDAPVPVHIPGLTHVVAIAASYEANGDYRGYSLALLADGTVRAWGTNASEELGTGKLAASALPIQVPRLHQVVSIAAGAGHALALERDGSVWSWGKNDAGQLGVSTNVAKAGPTRVPGLPAIAAIGVGSYHSLAVSRDGGIWTWGFNASGQLGDGTSTDRATPQRIQGVRGARALVGGTEHTLALESDGSVLAWGNDESGQLGVSQSDGSTLAPEVPIPGLPHIENIAAGEDYSIALAAAGQIWAWGDNGNGQLGIGVTHGCYVFACRDKPTLIPHIPPVAAIAAGGSTSLAVTRDGHVLAWGRNDYGQLGIGTVAYRPQPAPVYGLSRVTAVSAGFDHSLALTLDGNVWAWGYNWWGQLGPGVAADNRSVPSPVHGLHDVTAIAAGDQYSLALRKDGSVWAWGSDFDYGLGTDKMTLSAAPVRVGLPAHIVAIVAAKEHSIALTRDGKVFTWGRNECGQLGNGSTKDNAKPSVVHGINSIVAIAAAGCFSLALKRDGTVWGWGFNEEGELGSMPTATVDRSPVPVQIKGLKNITAIAAGDFHGMALGRDGTAWSWGLNHDGVLCTGVSTNTFKFRPAPIRRVHGVKGISADYLNSVLLTKAGTVWACGDNSYGQLGRTPSTPFATTPVQAPGLSGAVSIDAGTSYVLAITAP